MDDADARALPGKVGPSFTRFDEFDDTERDAQLNQLFTLLFIAAPDVASVAPVSAIEAGADSGFEFCGQLAHQAGDFCSVFFQLGEVEKNDPCAGDTRRAYHHETATVTWKRAGFEDLADCLSL